MSGPSGSRYANFDGQDHDTFVFGLGHGDDTIADFTNFSHGKDRIDVSALGLVDFDDRPGDGTGHDRLDGGAGNTWLLRYMTGDCESPRRNDMPREHNSDDVPSSVGTPQADGRGAEVQASPASNNSGFASYDEIASQLTHGYHHAWGESVPEPFRDSPIVTVDISRLTPEGQQASVMSYFTQTDNPLIHADYAEPVTPMIADITAIQRLYGAPVNIRSGDTTYGSNSNVGGYLGEFFAVLTGEKSDSAIYDNRPFALTIWDTGGVDTIDFRTDSEDQRINLLVEGISDVFGLTGNLVIARDTVIEHYVAGSGNDRVVGNDIANRLWGGEGRDTLQGAGGDDLNGSIVAP